MTFDLRRRNTSKLNGLSAGLRNPKYESNPLRPRFNGEAINGIESFWSYAKLRLAKLRGVRWEYFYDHLKETEWRFNHRRENLFNFLIINLGSTPLI